MQISFFDINAIFRKRLIFISKISYDYFNAKINQNIFRNISYFNCMINAVMLRQLFARSYKDNLFGELCNSSGTTQCVGRTCLYFSETKFLL